jgi:hypothetical protein
VSAAAGDEVAVGRGLAIDAQVVCVVERGASELPERCSKISPHGGIGAGKSNFVARRLPSECLSWKRLRGDVSGYPVQECRNTC